MLRQWCCPEQTLAVGKPEYKAIIQAYLGIPCLYNEAVMEVMWGIKNLMHSLVPQENSQLAKGDRLQMSQGLRMVLNRYGFDVKPEMVSDPIFVVACTLYDCDYCDKKVSGPLREAGDIIKDVSCISCEDWDLMKLATAVKMISFPGEKIDSCDPQEMFSKDELSKLVNDAPKYKDKLLGYNCLRAYKIVASDHKVRAEKHKLLGIVVKEAEEAYQAGQADCLRSWGLEEPSQDPKSCRQKQPSKRFLKEPPQDLRSCSQERPSKRLLKEPSQDLRSCRQERPSKRLLEEPSQYPRSCRQERPSKRLRSQERSELSI